MMEGMAGSASADGNKAGWSISKMEPNYPWMEPTFAPWCSKDQNNFECPYCNKNFKSRGSLSSHKYTYHRDEHAKTPTGVQPVKEFECVSCGKWFVSRGSLATHKYMYHRENKEANTSGGSGTFEISGKSETDGSQSPEETILPGMPQFGSL
jgi:transcription elongation factor Elf1